MRVASGDTTKYAYFVAVDATDFTTRETGLSSFTVYRSRNGGAAAAMTTPTINETDATNMAGVYELLLDEDTTIDAGDDEQEMTLHITHAGMAPVTRAITLFRPKATAGRTLGIESNGDLSTLSGHTAQTGDSFARLGAPAGSSVSADVANLPTVAEFEARTLVAADYFDPVADTVAHVTLVDTTTTNTDMRGTDNAAVPGDEMDLVDAPNATAIEAFGVALEDMILDEGDATALLAAIAAKVEEFLVNEGDATATIAAIATAVNTALSSAHGAGSWATATGFSTLDAGGVRTALGMAEANLDTQLGDLPTNAELATALGTADDDVLAAIAALSIPTAISIADAVLVRGASNVENTADRHSLAALVLVGTNSSFNVDGDLEAKKPSDDSVFATYAVTTDAAAEPITGVA